MDSFVVPPEYTCIILARQGYAAQSRRQGGFRRSMAQTADSFSFQHAMTAKPIRQHPAPEGHTQPQPIDIPSFKICSTTIGNHCINTRSSYAPSSVGSASPTTSCSPYLRRYLHESYSAQVRALAIEEYDDDGVVIYNGIKRMSVSEHGIISQSRPRLVDL